MATKDYEQRLRDINERLRAREEKEDYEFVLADRLRGLRYDRNNLLTHIGNQKTIMWPYDTSDLPRYEKYFKAEKELIALESRLKNLDEKNSMIENILEPKTHNPAPIPVPQHQGYEIPNGLLGVRRDLFNKLATHRLADDRDLQQRYEISKGVVLWKDDFAFKMKRPHQPLPDLNPKPLGRKPHK
jgi:hypothetical protein